MATQHSVFLASAHGLHVANPAQNIRGFWTNLEKLSATNICVPLTVKTVALYTLEVGSASDLTPQGLGVRP